ncbi:hypothetical protein DIJ64_11615 [Mycobacterium leprae]|uniref:Uncharacterized protein n=1 Tax=Mycobacterium leprae TaxID=1769 RepID=A0AAD0P9E5_MYCLR|nr:hypothetical protein DIJ64_11615 [Mycobacterium leprae]
MIYKVINHRSRDESKQVRQPIDHQIHVGFPLVDHDFDAAILDAAVGRVVAGDRVDQPFTL